MSLNRFESIRVTILANPVGREDTTVHGDVNSNRKYLSGCHSESDVELGVAVLETRRTVRADEHDRFVHDRIQRTSRVDHCVGSMRDEDSVRRFVRHATDDLPAIIVIDFETVFHEKDFDVICEADIRGLKDLDDLRIPYLIRAPGIEVRLVNRTAGRKYFDVQEQKKSIGDCNAGKRRTLQESFDAYLFTTAGPPSSDSQRIDQSCRSTTPRINSQTVRAASLAVRPSTSRRGLSSQMSNDLIVEFSPALRAAYNQ